LQPVAPAEENQPGQRDVGRRQRSLHFLQFWLGNFEIDRLMVQVLKDNG